MLCCYDFLIGYQNIHSTQAFLFSLKNRDNQPYMLTVRVGGFPQMAMRCASYYGPTFGYDLCVLNNLSSSNLGVVYKLPTGYSPNTAKARTLLAGSSQFKVDEYEVFFLITGPLRLFSGKG